MSGNLTMRVNKEYSFTVPFACDADLAGKPAKLLTTHPSDMVTLEFVCGSKLQVHLSSVIPAMGEP